MRNQRQYRFVLCAAALALLVVGAGLLVAGCGGQEPAPPAAPPAPAPAPEPAPAPPAPPAAAPAPAPAPVSAAAPVPAPSAPPAPATPRPEPAFKPITADVLKYTPANAQLAIALPPLNGTIAKAIPFAKRVAPPAVDIDALVQQAIATLASDLEAADAKTFADIALSKGLSLDAPIAVFADVSGTANSAIAAAEKAKAVVEKAKADAAAAATPPAPAADGTAAPAPATPAPAPEPPHIDFNDIDYPSVAGILGLSDAAKAEAALKALVADKPELKEGEPVIVGEVKINNYGPVGYFIAGDKLALGSMDLLKGIAERVAAPLALRYGGADCPATTPDEAAMLLYGERLLPLIEKALPLADLTGPAGAMLAGQTEMIKGLLSSQGGEDPLVTTVAWTKDMFEVKTRMDTGTHPGVLAYTGQAAPMKHAQLLPEGTAALLNFRLTPEWKKQMGEYMKGLPKDDVQVAQVASFAPQILTLLGEEITLGISGVKDDAPALFVMVGLANPENTKAFLQMIIPSAQAEVYKETPINNIEGVPTPIPLSITYVGDMMLLTNNVDKMKAVIDLVKDNKTTSMMTGLVPPLDPATPFYSALLVNASLWTDVVAPLNNILNFMPAEAKPIADQVTSIVREIRMMSEMDGTWQSSHLTIFFKDAA